MTEIYTDRLIDALEIALEELEPLLDDDSIAAEAYRAINELQGKHTRWWTEHHGTPHKLGRIPDKFID